MELRIEPTSDAELLARLNQEIQAHHVRLYPATFKAVALDEVKAFMAGRLADPAWRALMATVDGEAAGYALFYLREYAENPFRRAYRGVHVDQVSVDPRFKRRGVGHRLMAAVEAFAREQGATQLELTVWDRNEEARAFYAGLGFGTSLHFQVKSLAEPTFRRLLHPEPEVAAAFTAWENDPSLRPLIHHSPSEEELERRVTVTEAELERRLRDHAIYLVMLEGRLVGEASYQVDPGHLHVQEPGTAWIAIHLGEADARGRGVGRRAMAFLEAEIRAAGLRRIELGVFEYNEKAQALYRSMGYREIARLPGFTWWHGRLWADIRMEKRF